MKKTELFAKLEFVAFCIEQYKHKTQQKGLDVQCLFEERGVITFLLNIMKYYIHKVLSRFITK